MQEACACLVSFSALLNEVLQLHVHCICVHILFIEVDHRTNFCFCSDIRVRSYAIMNNTGSPLGS